MAQRGRPKKVLPLPEGLVRNQVVWVTSAEFRNRKKGIIMELCRYDGGIKVWITEDSTNDLSVYACIQVERGDTIESAE